MAEESQLGKLKEQYVDDVLTIVPLSQACFIVLMVAVSDLIFSEKSLSAAAALASVGIKSSIGVEGSFWDAKILLVSIALGLAFLNAYVLRTLLAKSLHSSGVGALLPVWQSAAARRIVGLTDDKKLVIHGSLKTEIESRLKKFKGKRIATEITASLLAVIIYANVLLLLLAWSRGGIVVFEWKNAVLVFIPLVTCILLHRSSVRYAISKILPLKVYAGVLTGELVFFEEVSG